MVTFDSAVMGTQPLSYQWEFKGAALTGATASSLTLTNVQLADAGAYRVVVSNSVGSVTSSDALLVVNVPPPCAPPASQLVGWWPAENGAVDIMGGNHGVASAGVTYVPGKVGQAFNFDGSTSSFVVPAATNLAFESMTFETWIMPFDGTTPRPIMEYANATGLCSMNFWYHLGPNIAGVPGALYAAFRNPDNSAVQLGSPGGLVVTGQWSHVALTFSAADSSVRLYHNGINVAATTSSIPIRAQSLLNVNRGIVRSAAAICGAEDGISASWMSPASTLACCPRRRFKRCMKRVPRASA